MRLPDRRPLALTAAAAVATLASPAIAQSADSYEYAQPARDGGVIYRSQEVVQGTPVAAHGAAMPAPLPPEPPLPPVPPMPPRMGHNAPPPPQAHAPDGYAVQPYPAPYPAYAPPMAAGFDREGWLADCHDRIRGVDRKDRGGVIGGLLGAIAGGVIGNRVWDNHRTAGTLLGAGVGGLAGLAVDSALGAAGDRRHADECADSLDRYMSSYPGVAAYPGYGYPGYGYAGYGYGGYALVPVLVAVPQHQVIRETVTEEWIDTPVRTRHVPARRPHPALAPARSKYIKGR